MTNSTISGNSAYGGGGVSELRHPHRDQQHHLGQFRRYDGGGVVNNGGTVTVTNSTISGNTRRSSTAACELRHLTMTNSTISGNTATAACELRHPHRDQQHHLRQFRAYGGGGVRNIAAPSP